MIYIKEDVYEQLINIALETKDFKWIEDLQKQRLQDNLIYTAKIITDEYINYGTAFEDITSQYVVKEEHGIRNIRFESEYDIIYGKVGITNGTFLYKGQKVNYRDITDEERLYLIGYVKGYYEGLSRVSSSYQINQHVSPPIQNSSTDKDVKNKKWWKLWD